MKKTHQIQEVCTSCNGTGLYVGMTEMDGAAIVCASCKGTGYRVHEYTPFKKRELRPNVKRVYQVNPGIVIREGEDLRLNQCGGMSYQDWRNGREFDRGMEMRKFTCPAWWYQCANYKKQPAWKRCDEGRKTCMTFSKCKFFHVKHECWAKFDASAEDGQ